MKLLKDWKWVFKIIEYWLEYLDKIQIGCFRKPDQASYGDVFYL